MVAEDPSELRPVTVAKPWGRELWYSGVEARGESGVCTPAGVVPLSQYLDGLGRTKPVILLKALQATAGKAEAGKAAIEAVQSFMNPVDLRSGDAVTIPLRVPHSLLKGMQVIEFQTPVFERKILAASQPVVTQQGWDVDAAVAAMDLSAKPAVKSQKEGGVSVIARTLDFTVTRYRLANRNTVGVPPWSVGWVVRGALRCRGDRFRARTAFLAPAATEMTVEAETEVLVATEA